MISNIPLETFYRSQLLPIFSTTITNDTQENPKSSNFLKAL
nr:MAG TPA: hypothetical protein [Bacteriophage sp.]